MEEKDHLQDASDKMNDTIDAIEKAAEEKAYQHIELRLTDAEGNVKIKGSMRVADMMKLEQFNGQSKGEIMQLFYFALEDDLLKKIENEK